MECKQLVVFKLENERYGINIEQVSAIEKDQNVSRIPNSMECIKGIINLRGSIIPVFDLKKKFNLTNVTNSPYPQLIIVKVYNMEIALEVDNVEQIFDVKDGAMMDIPKICLNEETKCFPGVLKDSQSLIVHINADKLFTEQEIEMLNEVTNM